MEEGKIGESSSTDALSYLRANRVVLARRVNEISRKIVDLRTELEMLDEELKAKAQQLEEVERGIRALSADHLSATRWEVSPMNANDSQHPTAGGHAQ
jgi:hypothetical protein